MKARSLFAVAALCAALVLPGGASAQSIAYALHDGSYTNLRAGPSTEYPIVARLYPGTRVDVLGCLDTRAWCDVIVQDIRGWIYARRLEFLYSGRRVLVPDYYSYFGAPFVIFRFGDRDWRDHDRDRNRYDKPIFGHPGGGGPGPVDRPGYDGSPSPDPDYFEHPGGGGPGPVDRPGPDSFGGGIITEEVPGPEGSGGGAGGLCAPGDPSCVEGTQ